MKKIALALCISLCAAIGVSMPSVARADTLDAGAEPTLDAGPKLVPAFEPSVTIPVDAAPQETGSAVVSTTTTTTTTTLPSDALHNPVDDPLKALDDAKQAKKQGWGLFILASLIMLTAGLAKAATKWPTLWGLSTINKHKTTLIISACLGVGVTAAYNALADGGSWYAVIGVGAIAAVTFISHLPSEPAQSETKA